VVCRIRCVLLGTLREAFKVVHEKRTHAVETLIEARITLIAWRLALLAEAVDGDKEISHTVDLKRPTIEHTRLSLDLHVINELGIAIDVVILGTSLAEVDLPATGGARRTARLALLFLLVRKYREVNWALVEAFVVQQRQVWLRVSLATRAVVDLTNALLAIL